MYLYPPSRAVTAAVAKIITDLKIFPILYFLDRSAQRQVQNGFQGSASVGVSRGESDQQQSAIHPHPESIEQIWTNLLLFLVGISGSISLVVCTIGLSE